jgi:uncharacterized cupredoxin-like copper-binding protein
MLALTTGHKIGLLAFAGGFIAFAILSAIVIPRFRPGFPGRGLPMFLLASVALFAAMLTAVLVFGRESEEAEAHGETTTEATSEGAQKLVVEETEFKIAIPSGTSLEAGTYRLEAKNEGKVDHDLAVDGPGVDEKTPVFGGGETASLEVALEPGTYDFYCSVPGHKQAGMDLKVTVS